MCRPFCTRYVPPTSNAAEPPAATHFGQLRGASAESSLRVMSSASGWGSGSDGESSAFGAGGGGGGVNSGWLTGSTPSAHVSPTGVIRHSASRLIMVSLGGLPVSSTRPLRKIWPVLVLYDVPVTPNRPRVYVMVI